MSPKELTAFRIDPEQMEGLRAIKDREDIPISAQVRRALEMWLASKGIKTKADRKRVGARKRP